MNTKFFSRTVSLFAALTLSACAPRNPAKPVDPADLAAKATSTAGGQPGKISVYGVIADPSYAPQVQLKPSPGTGKDGKKPETLEASKPVTDTKLPAQLPAAPSEEALKKAIALGCSPEQTANISAATRATA